MYTKDEIENLIVSHLSNAKKRQGTAQKNYNILLKDYPELQKTLRIHDVQEIMNRDKNKEAFKKLPKPKTFLLFSQKILMLIKWILFI